ncbi:RloB family protein [Streptococcus sp. SS-4456]|uniref:RloB family protein n=1 Tax=Streptococcus sp. SS-4456 TaxID=3072286 RepID=UPI002FC83686
MGYKTTSFRMGEGTPRYTPRKSNTRQENSYVFVLAEGAETEPIYFKAFYNHPRIKNREVMFLNRLRQDTGRSNPLQIGQSICDFFQVIEQVEESDLKLLEGYQKSLRNDPPLQTAPDIYKRISKISEKYKGQKLINPEENTLQQLSVIIALSKYDKEVDTICLIVDRDKESFTEQQYDQLIKLCQKEGFELGISNPCFEVYLLMHLSDLSLVSLDDLLENAKEENRTLAERLLREEMGKLGENFSKKSYNPHFFIDQFEVGLANNMAYAQTNKELKGNVGSSVFSIVDRWLNN